jgi:general stress protein 26
MDRGELLSFLRSQRWAIEATVSTAQAPQAAIIGIVTTDQLELVFDTRDSSRKATNLRTNPGVALVIGGWNDGDPRTVQCEGLADFPVGAELERLKQAYYAAFPNGPTRHLSPDITYVRVKPTWIRYSDFRAEPPVVAELVLPAGVVEPPSAGTSSDSALPTATRPKSAPGRP